MAYDRKELESNFETDWAGWTEVKKPMKTFTMHLPEEMVEQLKYMAPKLGFQGYQDLIRYYVHDAMMRDLEAMRKLGDKYEIARKMADNGASPKEISAFLERE